MDKANPWSTLMIGRTLNVENDPFEILMYLAKCARLGIAFAVNLLAKLSLCKAKEIKKV